MRMPIWFRIVAILLVLWGLMGCYACYAQLVRGPDAWGPGITDWDRAFYAALPVWYNAVYIVAVGCGAAGAIALLLRSAMAVPLFLLSVVAIVVMFGWTFVATDLIAHKGVVVATGFPLFILALGLFQFWLARRARRRRWIA